MVVSRPRGYCFRDLSLSPSQATSAPSILAKQSAHTTLLYLREDASPLGPHSSALRCLASPRRRRFGGGGRRRLRSWGRRLVR